jgi:hypothetical protein
MVVPIIPEKPPKIKYNIPISLWLTEKSHLDEKEYKLELIIIILVKIRQINDKPKIIVKQQ